MFDLALQTPSGVYSISYADALVAWVAVWFLVATAGVLVSGKRGDS